MHPFAYFCLLSHLSTQAHENGLTLRVAVKYRIASQELTNVWRVVIFLQKSVSWTDLIIEKPFCSTVALQL